MFSKLLIVMTAAIVAVNAQSSPSTTSVPTLDACILACVEPAATQNGCAYTDVQCVCASAQFQADATACLKQHCTSTDLSAALGLQSAECDAVSVSASDTGSLTPNSVSFTLASSDTASSGGIATTSGTTTSTITTSTSTTTTTGASTAAITATTTPTTTTGITTGTSTTIAPATTTSSAAAAPSLVANGGVGAIVAIIAGLLAL